MNIIRDINDNIDTAYNKIVSYASPLKIPIYILIAIIIFSSCIQYNISVVFTKNVLPFMFTLCIINVLLICLSLYSLTFSTHSSDLYLIIMAIYTISYILHAFLFFRLHQQYKNKETKYDTRNVNLIETALIISVVATVLNFLFYNKSLVYLINIMFSIFFFSQFIYIYKL